MECRGRFHPICRLYWCCGSDAAVVVVFQAVCEVTIDIRGYKTPRNNGDATGIVAGKRVDQLTGGEGSLLREGIAGEDCRCVRLYQLQVSGVDRPDIEGKCAEDAGGGKSCGASGA